jgi:hypothetical protein
VTKSRNPVILSVIQHRQNPLETVVRSKIFSVSIFCLYSRIWRITLSEKRKSEVLSVLNQFNSKPWNWQSRSHITTDGQSVSQPVSQSVSLGVRPPSGTRDQFFFLLDNFFTQLRVCYFVSPSLTRGRVCDLLLLLVLIIAVTLGLPSLTRSQVCLLSAFCQ